MSCVAAVVGRVGGRRWLVMRHVVEPEPAGVAVLLLDS